MNHLLKEYKLLNTKLLGLTVDEYHELILSKIKGGDKTVIISQNLHSLYLQFRSLDLNAIQQKYLVRIDGMSIILLARILGNKEIKRKHRLTWMDWKDIFFPFCEENQLKIFYVGSKPEFQSEIQKYMNSKYPNLVMENHDGYFKLGSKEEDILIDEINSFKPQIILVGMGMPRQEKWIDANLNRIDSNVFLSCGAAMEYIVGNANVPPRWIGQIGLEWLYRLVEKPRRFFHRYLVEPWYLFFYICKYYLTK
jgi:N-acetylglucosaminyldiphosphoundecaprenol N-acetyl-beta-D-mannosaminyltransferase